MRLGWMLCIACSGSGIFQRLSSEVKWILWNWLEIYRTWGGKLFTAKFCLELEKGTYIWISTNLETVKKKKKKKAKKKKRRQITLTIGDFVFERFLDVLLTAEHEVAMETTWAESLPSVQPAGTVLCLHVFVLRLLPSQSHLGRHDPLSLCYERALGTRAVLPATVALVTLEPRHHAVVATTRAFRRPRGLPVRRYDRLSRVRWSVHWFLLRWSCQTPLWWCTVCFYLFADSIHGPIRDVSPRQRNWKNGHKYLCLISLTMPVRFSCVIRALFKKRFEASPPILTAAPLGIDEDEEKDRFKSLNLPRQAITTRGQKKIVLNCLEKTN